ncbi:MAG: VWA domain-containing protein [Nanoarchaeota archaeon]|nr:VWA domain-containing protein [Nanoarchaeota archaeon]
MSLKKKRVIFPDSIEDTKLKRKSQPEFEKTKEKPSEGDKLMNSVLMNDKKIIEEGLIINDAVNHGFNFTPDLMFENLVKDYRSAKKLYGKTLIRKLTGYDDDFIRKNIKLPEFRRELKDVLEKRITDMKKDKIVGKEGEITESGYELGSLVLYTDELDSLIAKGIGEKILKKNSSYGDAFDVKQYKKGDLYRNIDMRKTIQVALRRGHNGLAEEDLRVSLKKSKGKINIVYAIDSSGSMRGKKIEMAKKAGVALIYKALENKDNVGLVLFRTDVVEKVPPIDDFSFLLSKIVRARALRETNLTKAIIDATDLFMKTNTTKHLVLITDAMPTVGKTPVKEALSAAVEAANSGITISLIGINLTDKGKELAQKIVEVGKGRLYTVKDVENIDVLVLEDYESVI